MKKNIIFTLPAEALEGAHEAVILGDFNNWTPAKEFELKRQKNGSYKAIVQLEEGKTYQYRFLLDDGRWVNDYHAQNYEPVSGYHVDNCVITVPQRRDIEKKPKKAASTSKAVKEEGVKTKKISDQKAAAKPGAKVEKAAKPGATKAKSSDEKKKSKKVAKPLKKGISVKEN